MRVIEEMPETTEAEEVVLLEAEPVMERCTWCGEDISRSRHAVYRTNCRICGNIVVQHHIWLMRQEEKKARKLAGLPPEDERLPLTAEEIKQAITGRRVKR